MKRPIATDRHCNTCRYIETPWEPSACLHPKAKMSLAPHLKEIAKNVGWTHKHRPVTDFSLPGQPCSHLDGFPLWKAPPEGLSWKRSR